MDNSRVVERALFLFKDESFMELLGRRSHAVMKPLLAALLRGGEPFWNPTVTKASIIHVVIMCADCSDSTGRSWRVFVDSC